MALSEVEQSVYVIVVFSLLAYILFFCKHGQNIEEGFQSTFDDVSEAKSFVMSGPDGSIGALGTGNVATQLRQQIDGAALAMYNAAMRDSNAALGPVTSALNDQVNSLNREVSDAASRVNANTASMSDITNNALYITNNMSPFGSKSYQIMSMREKPPDGKKPGDPNTSNCLDSGSNWQRCDPQNAHRRFQIQVTPYGVNDWSSTG